MGLFVDDREQIEAVALEAPTGLVNHTEKEQELWQSVRSYRRCRIPHDETKGFKVSKVGWILMSCGKNTGSWPEAQDAFNLP